METQTKKPKAEVLGQDGNVFNLMGICSNALKKAGQREKVSEMQGRCMKSESYDQALKIMGEYCDLV